MMITDSVEMAEAAANAKVIADLDKEQASFM